MKLVNTQKVYKNQLSKHDLICYELNCFKHKMGKLKQFRKSIYIKFIPQPDIKNSYFEVYISLPSKHVKEIVKLRDMFKTGFQVDHKPDLDNKKEQFNFYKNYLLFSYALSKVPQNIIKELENE